MGRRAAIILLVLDILAGLSLFFVHMNKLAASTDAIAGGATDEQKKIALTFDEEVIIRLSQEICCK